MARNLRTRVIDRGQNEIAVSQQGYWERVRA